MHVIQTTIRGFTGQRKRDKIIDCIVLGIVLGISMVFINIFIPVCYLAVTAVLCYFRGRRFDRDGHDGNEPGTR